MPGIFPRTRHFGLASKDVLQMDNMRVYLKSVVQEGIDASQAIEQILQSGVIHTPWVCLW